MSISLSEEVAGAEFGDKRLDDRLEVIVKELGNNPNLSIPAATTSRAEMEAAYRFCDNVKVTPEKILEPHFQATRKRISSVDFAILAQDTTILDLTRPSQQVEGAGPVETNSRRGAFLHPLQAYSLEGLPLGMVWQKFWAREKIETQLTREEKTKKRKETPIEEKESLRWIQGVEAAQKSCSSLSGNQLRLC